jgi:glutamate N-acetyltransferase/amino-acid N-acetyltransferase
MTLTEQSYQVLPNPSVTAARGFRAGAIAAGIKASGNLDLGYLVSDVPCVAAATFTPNHFPAAPVVLSRQHIANGRAQAIVFNSGNANACNGEQGLTDATEMANTVANLAGIDPSMVLVASTGIIGVPMPMDVIRAGLPRVKATADGGDDAALGIMTTDSHPKKIAVSVQVDGREVRIGGMCKGVGMIHPNMATMLAFIATDAALSPSYVRPALQRAVARTFNMITVDGDTSTNDSCFLLANGLAGNEPLTEFSPDAERFEEALRAVCEHLAREMAGDGEGATKLIQVDVTGARTESDARAAARAVVKSSLVKAAVHGSDPNWGRVFMAVGNADAEVHPLRASLWIGNVQVAKNGVATTASKDEARAQMEGKEVQLRVDLGLGDASARAWGCDLTEEYVHENSAYST